MEGEVKSNIQPKTSMMLGGIPAAIFRQCADSIPDSVHPVTPPLIPCNNRLSDPVTTAPVTL